MIWPSQLQDCLEDVLKLLLEFLLGFGEGVLLVFTHWCFGNLGRGAHVEIVKGLVQIYYGQGYGRNEKFIILR